MGAHPKIDTEASAEQCAPRHTLGSGGGQAVASPMESAGVAMMFGTQCERSIRWE